MKRQAKRANTVIAVIRMASLREVNLSERARVCCARSYTTVPPRLCGGIENTRGTVVMDCHQGERWESGGIVCQRDGTAEPSRQAPLVIERCIAYRSRVAEAFHCPPSTKAETWIFNSSLFEVEDAHAHVAMPATHTLIQGFFVFEMHIVKVMKPIKPSIVGVEFRV